MKKIILLLLTILLSLSMLGCKEKIPPLTLEDVNEFLGDIKSDDISYYILSDAYRNEKEMEKKSLGKDFDKYSNAEFVVTNLNNKEKQEACFDYFVDEFEWDKPKTINKDSIFDAITALKEGEGDALIVPSEIIEKLKTSEDERILELVNGLEFLYKFDESKVMDYSLTKKPFLLYVGGSDSRAKELDDTSRYDVDMILAINPINKQIFIVSIPRDMYTPNPAHGSNYDKLTHLGDDGPENMMKGLSQFFGVEIDKYAITNFVEFTRFIDVLGGLDIYNPYAFSTFAKTYYEQGNIHLDGKNALIYARERKSLPYNDMSRNEHQVILLKAIIEKVMNLKTVEEYAKLASEVEVSYMTNLDLDQLVAFAKKLLINEDKWTVTSQNIVVSYQLRNTATYTTNGPLYVGIPNDEEIQKISKDLKEFLK